MRTKQRARRSYTLAELDEVWDRRRPKVSCPQDLFKFLRLRPTGYLRLLLH